MKLTAKQEQAQAVLASDATHILLIGGSRSGKTFLLVRNVVFRALKAGNSRHAIFRYRTNAVEASVVKDTFPKVMRECFPGVEFSLTSKPSVAAFPNGSEIWFSGLDDKDRVEKVLGMEFVTIYLNEASQIPQSSRDVAVTRLAQQVTQSIENRQDRPLKPRMYYDANPPSKAHWLYRLFVQKVDPETKLPLRTPEDYAYFKINPADNVENVSAGYLDTLKNLSARLRKRFLDGEFADATPNQLFTDETMETWRVMDMPLPEMVRVVVAVDPSGSGEVDNADNDAIGIVVGGLGTDGNAYLLEDCTVKAGPATWGKIATDAFDRHAADIIVGEMNYGGAMVRQTIQTARARTPFRGVNATRGKSVRAEPFSALYEQGKVRHAGIFRELEDEMAGFSTVGYTGEQSPNRADAWIWCLAELFPAMTRAPETAYEPPIPMVSPFRRR